MSEEEIPATIRLLLEARAEITVENWMTVNFIAGAPSEEIREVALEQARTEIDNYLQAYPADSGS